MPPHDRHAAPRPDSAYGGPIAHPPAGYRTGAGDVLKRIGGQRVLPVLRCESADDAVATARACARGGMTVILLTSTTPAVASAFRELREDGLLLGLGAVTGPAGVAVAVEGGARFVVSYAVLEDVVAAAWELGVVAIPGALTPTEVLRAVHAGALAVNLFPAGVVSPSYVRELGVLLPGLRPLITGAFEATDESIRAWLEAGAFAVGFAGGLGTVALHGADEVERRARAALHMAARVGE